MTMFDHRPEQTAIPDGSRTSLENHEGNASSGHKTKVEPFQTERLSGTSAEGSDVRKGQQSGWIGQKRMTSSLSVDAQTFTPFQEHRQSSDFAFTTMKEQKE